MRAMRCDACATERDEEERRRHRRSNRYRLDTRLDTVSMGDVDARGRPRGATNHHIGIETDRAWDDDARRGGRERSRGATGETSEARGEVRERRASSVRRR